MEAKAKNVVGVYETEQEAIHAVESLKKEGYGSEEISIIGKHKKTKKVQKETNTKAEGAATGALTGGTLGSLTGILAGAGALAIPGIGPIVAAGPIVATLTGAAAGASVGGLSGILVGMGIPKQQAEHYNDSVKEGSLLVLVDKENCDHDGNPKAPLTGMIL
ncbi:general stress protein [Priestia aryabhattai]|uniref:general stress protein n=1 Tax=Priestia aryabhattai TaxID=412384 RepID=UPI000B4389AD|nr:general stress protein [Priestia aryabhattai]MBX9967621.1 general stress protein [Priestia aryabhattai]MDH3113735.1 general stress protein [Priestia aryabhattai]MDH3127361.1 general stress protein [Priestia aryabhattai]MED4155645.1 general stress protein [Priestia aryabhattai]OUT31870.1 general stress protein [Priestia aryabhattai]